MNFNEAIRIFNAKRGLEVKAGQINGQDRDLRNFAIFMRDCPIEDVTDEHVVEWITYYKNFGYKVGTLIKKEEALIQFFKFWERKISLSLDPFNIPLTDKEWVKPRICSEENYHKLLEVYPLEGKLGMGSNTFNVRNRIIIAFLWNTGIRISELINLNVSDLNLEQRLVTIKTLKSKGVVPFRVIPYDTFDDEVIKALPIWLEAREKIIKEKPLEEPDTLFFGYKTTRPLGKRFAVNALGEIFAKTSKKAGLSVDEYVNAHSLRHHYGRSLAKLEFRDSVISQSMGHANINSSRAYTQLEPVDLVKVLRREGLLTRVGR